MDLCEHHPLKSLPPENRHPWELARFRICRKFIQEFTRPGDKIVDIGCGDAFIVSSLAKTFPDRTFLGLDPGFDKNEASLLKQNLGLDNLWILSTWNDMTIDFEGISAFILLDVLEHVNDAPAFMKEIWDRFDHVQHLSGLITVPAFHSLMIQRDVFLKHFRRYNRKMLRQHLSRNKFSYYEDGYCFISIFPIRIIQVVMERIGVRSSKTKRTSLSEWKFPKQVSTMLHSILYSDFVVLRYLSRIGCHLPGLSCYTILQK